MYSVISTKHLTKSNIEGLLFRANYHMKNYTNTQLHGTVATVFAEPSTRTSLSFQMAAQRLGLNVLNFSAETSSFKKGETLLDTLQTLEAIGVDVAVIRTGEDWPALRLEEKVGMSLVNAGSGMLEHPTQALLDALTIQQSFGTFQGLKVTIVGDVLHSRVARSNIDVLKKLGANVQLAGPQCFKAADLENVAPWVDFDEAVATSDVVMMLRIQFERHQGKLAPSLEEYHQQYGLTMSRVHTMKDKSIIMHPGPVNRGVEISDEVMEHPKSQILPQVTNGVGIRMAVLEQCMESRKNEQLATA